jgi:hypothetical protein
LGIEIVRALVGETPPPRLGAPSAHFSGLTCALAESRGGPDLTPPRYR